MTRYLRGSRGVSEVNKEPWIHPATLSCVRCLTLSRIDRPLLALAYSSNLAASPEGQPLQPIVLLFADRSGLR